MKAKVKYRKYGNIPNMDTVKDIIVYGAKQGKQKGNKHYCNKGKAGNAAEEISVLNLEQSIAYGINGAPKY